MSLATDANVRTTQAAAFNGHADALRVSLTGGAFMGFTVVGLGLAGLSLVYYLMTLGRNDEFNNENLSVFALESVSGFGFGVSAIALFLRVSGGIFTKVCYFFLDSTVLF